MPEPQLLACSEYSASTNQDTLLSVTSGVGRRSANLPGHIGWQLLRDNFLLCQHRAAKDQKIDMWFWTYHIRKNRNYQGQGMGSKTRCFMMFPGPFFPCSIHIGLDTPALTQENGRCSMSFHRGRGCVSLDRCP